MPRWQSVPGASTTGQQLLNMKCDVALSKATCFTSKLNRESNLLSRQISARYMLHCDPEDG